MASLGRVVALEIVSVLVIYAEYRLALAGFVNALATAITDLPAIDAIDSGLWLLVGVFVLVWSIMFALTSYRKHNPGDPHHSRHAVEAWFATLAATFLAILVASAIGLAGLPSFAISDRNWSILGTLWMLYVLKQNPATYIIIVAITILAWQLVFQAILKV